MFSSVEFQFISASMGSYYEPGIMIQDANKDRVENVLSSKNFHM